MKFFKLLIIVLTKINNNLEQISITLDQQNTWLRDIISVIRCK